MSLTPNGIAVVGSRADDAERRENNNVDYVVQVHVHETGLQQHDYLPPYAGGCRVSSINLTRHNGLAVETDGQIGAQAQYSIK
jgi:hypothetical protein